MSKVCSTCQVELPLSDFGKHKSYSDGLDYTCRVCKCKQARKSYHTDVEASRSRKRTYRENPKVKSQRAEYARKRQASRTEEERSKERARVRAYKASRPGLAAGYCRSRREKKLLLDYQQYDLQDERVTRIAFSYRCAKCQSYDNIQIDHHYPLSAGHGIHLDNAALLCKSCNSSKGAKMPEEFYGPSTLERIEYLLALVQTGGPM